MKGHCLPPENLGPAATRVAMALQAVLAPPLVLSSLAVGNSEFISLSENPPLLSPVDVMLTNEAGAETETAGPDALAMPSLSMAVMKGAPKTKPAKPATFTATELAQDDDILTSVFIDNALGFQTHKMGLEFVPMALDLHMVSVLPNRRPTRSSMHVICYRLCLHSFQRGHGFLTTASALIGSIIPHAPYFPLTVSCM